MHSGPSDSFLARLDPRGKLVLALLFCLLAALGKDVGCAFILLGLGLGLTVCSGLGLARIAKQFAAVNVFVAFVWVFLPFDLGYGPDGLSLGHRPSGETLALLVSLKANAVFFCLLGLLGTSRVNDIFHALAHLRLPQKLVFIFLLFYRYVHVIKLEYLSLRRAMRIRCFTPRSDLHTYRSYGYLVGMLLARSFDRATRVYQAMLLRGFDGTLWTLDHFAWRRRDTIFCWVFACALLTLGLLEFSGLASSFAL